MVVVGCSRFRNRATLAVGCSGGQQASDQLQVRNLPEFKAPRDDRLEVELGEGAAR